MSENNFEIMLQAVLDKIKSITNIKTDIKSIESELPKMKIQATLDTKSINKDIEKNSKDTKIKVDADTTIADNKIKQIGKQETSATIKPVVDNSQVVSSLKETQKETKGLFDRFLNGAIGVNLVRMSVQKVTQAIHEAIIDIKELDKIKTDIQTVSGASDSQVNGMMASYNQMAKSLSSTTKETAEAANEFLRMGESVSDTNELIKNSQVLSKVGMIESADAASCLISSMKGYQVAAEDSINIIDKLTAVDLEAAVSAGGLAEAMSRTANIANNSGTSMDRLVGYMATVGEVTQDSMSVIGNSFKSMYSRMNNIKIGKFVDDETGESLSDTEKVLNKLGIKLRDTEDTYRNFDDVLDDVGNNWKNFTQVEQNAISVAIAGTMQRERFIALMNNYSNALKYSETAANSAGSALERYGVYQDSIEAKTNELTAAIESLSTSTISEEMFSGIIEATTGIVEFIDKFGILKGTLAGFVTMGISKAFVSMATGIVTAAKSTTQLTAAMALFRNGRDVDNLRNIGMACKGLSDNQLKLILSTKNLEYADRLLILEGMGVAEAEREQTLATLGFASAENVATGATFSLKGAMSALWTTICANPIGVLVTTVSAVTMAFSAYKQHQEEIRQATEEATNAYKESASSIDDYVSRYQELRKALIAAIGNEEETIAVKKQLLDLQTEINDKFGATCGTIDLVTNSYRDMTQSIKDYNKELANNYLNEKRKGIELAENKMDSDKTYHLGTMNGMVNADELKILDRIKQIASANRIDFTDKGFQFVGSAEEATESINNFMNEIKLLQKESGNVSGVMAGIFDGILDNSSDSLSNANDIINKYGEMYNQAKIAQISADENLSKGYNDALKAVEEYNNAVLASEDPYSDEKVASARQNLEDIKQSIQGNTEEWGQYSSVMDDVFDQADTRLIDFNDRLQNDDSLRKYAEELKGLDALDLQSFDQNVGKNNAFDQLKESAGSCGVSVEELIDRLVELGIVQDEIAEEAQNISKPFSQRFQDLWDSESFSDTKEELQKLAKEAGITEDDLYSLARENEELASLLTESGISAQFAATCFNRVCDGADGFSAITEDARALDQVLHGMDESLQSVAASKSAYDKAMEQDDYNSDFENYQEAYKSAMEMFENGDYGKHFRSTMEYLLGDKSYTMGIDEMYDAVKNLKNVFGEDATNGLEFLDKLYAKKEILDGMDSSLEKLSDGSYDFDLKPEDFEAIGEAIGMTADEVAACTNALGMFGDFRSYDMEELENNLNNISIAAKDGEKSILSLQGVESILSDLGYNGYEIYHILEDIKGMGSLELLDFNASDSEGLQTVIDKLSELKMLKIDGKNIDVSGLADKLKDTFGMTIEDIQTFLASLGKNFDFTDSLGTDVVDAYSNIQEKIKSIQADIASGSYSADEIVQMQAQLEELQRRADALREPVDIKLTSNIDQTKEKLEEVTRKYDELKASIESKQEQGITVTYGDTNALNELANQKAALEEQLNHYKELKVTVDVEREQADADIKDLTSDKETNLTVNIANKGEIDAQFSQWMQPKSTTLRVDVAVNDPNGALKGGIPTTGSSGNNTSASGAAGALGNAQIGHSFADGTIGAPKTETALINELGNETIIDPQSGTYEIVEGGAQFRKIKKGQIILNHLQTQALQKYGKISSFGKMLFGGNAKLNGSSYASGTAGGTNPATKKPYQNNSSTKKQTTPTNPSSSPSKAVQEAQEATEEFFDWIERRIKKFQTLFDKWIKQAETAVTSGFINKYYKKATSAIKNELSTYGKAYKRYMKQADSAGLSKKYRDKVKNGTIDIQSIKDEKLAEQIKRYQEYYDKAQESTTSFVETAEKLYNLPLDKAATKIEKFSDSIDLLDKKLDNAVGAKSKNKLIDKQTKEEKKTLDAYKDANKETKSALKSAKKELSKSKNLNADDGITKKEKKKIQSALKAGKEVDLSYFKVGSAGYNAAVKYNEALKANTQSTYDLQSAQEDYKSWLSEASVQKFENVQTDYEHKLHEFEQRAQEIDNKISLNEEKGYLASAVYYDKLIANEQQNNAKLIKERDALVKSLNDSVSSGNLKEYSDDWYDMKEKIDAVTNAVDESTISIQNFMNTIREIKWDRFDTIQSKVSGLLEDVKFAVNELSRTELVSDKVGGFTDNGKSVAALHVSDYETYRVQAADYAREIRNINNEIANNPYDTKLIDRKRELTKAYEDCISGAQEEKYAVIDLYKQAYDSLLNKIRELISEYEELLDAEKRAYDYQQSIAEKTKDIADIRKQITAYSGDLSEEARAKIQKLEIDLKEAEKSLQEAQYERYISDTKDMFDDLEDTLSDEINDLILALSDNFDRLIDNINVYSKDAMENVNDYLSKIGFDTSSSISNVGILISNAINSGTDISRATYTTVDEIKSLMEKMQQYVDSIANGGNASSGEGSVSTAQPAISEEEQRRQSVANEMAALQSQMESLYKDKTDIENNYNNEIDKALANASTQKSKAKKEKDSKKKKEYQAKQKEYETMAKDLENKKKEEVSIISNEIARLEQELAMLELQLNGIQLNPVTPKYAKGSKSIPYDQLAITQEKGTELIRTGSGALLTPLKKGDMVFTNEMSENLWKLAQTDPSTLWNIKSPAVTMPEVTRNMENNVTVQMGDIVMNGVNDPKTFGQQMRDEICKNDKTTKCFAVAMAAKFQGKGIGNARLWR